MEKRKVLGYIITVGTWKKICHKFFEKNGTDRPVMACNKKLWITSGDKISASKPRGYRMCKKCAKLK